MVIKLKKYLNYGVLVILLISTFWVIFSKLDFRNFLYVLEASNPVYLIGGVICMILFLGIEAWILDILLKRVNPEIKSFTAIKITLVGQYYSYLTPFSSGGQPAQLYELRKDNIPLTSGTAVLVSKFILYQVTATIYALVLAILKLPMILENTKIASTFIFIGLFINTFGMTAIVMIAFNSDKMKKVIKKIILWLKYIHIIKKSEQCIDKSTQFIDEYVECLNKYKEDWVLTLRLFCATIIQLTAFFSITFFVYKALGLSGTSIYQIITLQALLYIAIVLIPSPGTVGAAEVGFALLLKTVFSSNLITAALLLWRCLSYYLGLIVCGIFTFYLYTFRRRMQVPTR
jgi:uncharacterized protein (TIRG00374 family)